jgi:MarR family transcriptional regulator, lower aerobic nicotinate degradation pathway regulator
MTTPALLMNKPTWLLSQVSAHAHAVLAARLGGVGARGYHVRVLAALAEFGPASQAALGRHAEMDRSDVTATVGELAAAGLVERAADAGDRRRNVITLTAAGLARLRELDGILTAVQGEVLEPLSADERSVLTGLLTRLVLREH